MSIFEKNQKELEKSQNRIAEELGKSYNVSVDSVSGSGKTTSILKIEKTFPNENILVLTYNKMLKNETQKRLTSNTSIEAKTYHSFACKYIEHSKNDNELTKAVYECKPKKNFMYKCIVIDEAQDMNPLYNMLVNKILLYSKNYPLLCVIGDKKQCIYGSLSNNINLSADERFLTKAEYVFNKTSPHKWKHLTLPYSYRVPHEISSFINNCMLNGEKRITSIIKRNIYPIYMKINTFNEAYDIYDKIIELIKEQGYKPGNFFILDNSVKNGKRPVRILENLIVSNTDYKVYVPKDDDESMSNKSIDDKIVFCTYHQSKGRERKCVIVYGFDSFFPHNELLNCPNTLYVATTRSSEQLILVHNQKNKELNFINSHNIKYYCINHLSKTNIPENNQKPIKYNCTTLVRHVNENTIDECLKHLKIYRKESDKNKLKLQNDKNGEDVSDVNGIVIPLLFQQDYEDSFIDIYELLKKGYQRDEHEEWFRDRISEALDIYRNNKTISINDALFFVNVWVATKRGFYHTVKQVKTHDWLSKDIIQESKRRLKNILKSENLKFEEYSCKSFDKERVVKGYTDIVDENYVYEIKCVEELSNEDILQSVIYQWLQNKDYSIIYNVKTDFEMIVHGDASTVVKLLIENKEKNSNEEISDKEFFEYLDKERQKI